MLLLSLFLDFNFAYQNGDQNKCFSLIFHAPFTHKLLISNHSKIYICRGYIKGKTTMAMKTEKCALIILQDS